MASSYSTDLKLELMVTGEDAGTWGDITNTNLVILQQSIAGYSSITLNAAKILGIDNLTGSIETGKDANIIISLGDILDMRGNQLTQAFIQGRTVSLDNKQLQLYERYKHKYGIK